jgi:hypothetical protein
MLTDGPEPDRIRLGRPYLKIAAVVALAAGILGLGYLGPHPATHVTAQPSSQSPISPVPSPAVARADPTAVPSATPTPDSPRLLQALTGLPQVGRASSETISWLPLQITSKSPSVVGNRLFYVVGGDHVESSVLGSTADPKVLVSVPRCQMINQIAAAGGYLAYVVTFPGRPSATVGGCDGFGQVTWSLWLVNLATGSVREVASGLRQSDDIGVAETPIHIALTPSAYAFDRPDAGTGSSTAATVEVHSMDGRTLWTTRTDARVTQVMLGGDELGVVTQQVAPGVVTSTLWLADPAHPRLREVARPASSASLSPDGAYLTWDLEVITGLSRGSVMPDVGVEETASGKFTFLDPPTTTDGNAPTQPIVSTTPKGPIVAWFAASPSGTLYPAFYWLASGKSGFLESVQQPVWMAIVGSSLIWVAEGADGWSSTAFAADLSAL